MTAALFGCAALVVVAPAWAGGLRRTETISSTRTGVSASTGALVDASSSSVRAGRPTGASRMLHLMQTLGTFQEFAKHNREGMTARHRAEQQRLREAINATQDSNVRAELELSLRSDEQAFVNTSDVYSNMVHFADSMTSLLSSAATGGFGCEDLACGEHATCTQTTDGAQCVCNEGFVGVGTDCKPPPEFHPHRLLFEGTGGVPTQATDINMCVFGSGEVAIVFRDISRGNIGRIVVAKIREAGMADLSPPEQFTEPYHRAFNPVVAGTQDRRLLVAWRDESRGGTGWHRGAVLGNKDIRGADMVLNWGEQKSFSRNQAHKMSLVTLPENKVAVLYVNMALGTDHTPPQSFGQAALVNVDEHGSSKVLNQVVFTEQAVCRLEVTKVSPTAFVIAARGAKKVDEMDGSVMHQEAMAIFGEVLGDAFAFDPTTVSLEPNETEIWGRGISLVAPNTVAYAYQSGKSQEMKIAMVRVNSEQDTPGVMKIVKEPVVFRQGFSPYIQMLSVPYTASDPHTLAYYQGANSSLVTTCSWDDANATLHKCEEFQWLASKVSSVHGVHLGGGKSFLVFTSESGTPYYTVFGVAKRPL